MFRHRRQDRRRPVIYYSMDNKSVEMQSQHIRLTTAVHTHCSMFCSSVSFQRHFHLQQVPVSCGMICAHHHRRDILWFAGENTATEELLQTASCRGAAETLRAFSTCGTLIESISGQVKQRQRTTVDRKRYHTRDLPGRFSKLDYPTAAERKSAVHRKCPAFEPPPLLESFSIQ